MNPPKTKPTKATGRVKAGSKSKKAAATSETLQDQYHFLSYVPYKGRVWEMDGLKSAPLECAELDPEEPWLEAVLPALRGRIEALSKSGDIRFNLLAIVPCAYQKKMVEFEFGKREVTHLERQLRTQYGDTWKEKVWLLLYCGTGINAFRCRRTSIISEMTLLRSQVCRVLDWELALALAQTSWP